MAMIWLGIVIVGLVGLITFVGGARGVGRRRVASGGAGLVFGAVLLMGVGLAALVGLNLQTYNRLSYEQKVADISFVQTGPRAYMATVTVPPSEKSDTETVTEYALVGDEWRMDARVLKFHPWANVAGLDAVYKLDRLQGRYADVASEQNAPRAVHALSSNAGLDVYELARGRAKDLNAVDASYGSSVYLPMVDAGAYEVKLTQSGLVARPTNEAAEEAARDWR